MSVQVGELRKVRTPFYDTKKSQMSTKSRPGIVIGVVSSTDNDLVVLPISTMSAVGYIDPYYDVFITRAAYPNLKSPRDCYIRTHKSTTVNEADTLAIGINLKSEYPDLFVDIMAKYEEFTRKVIDEAL